MKNTIDIGGFKIGGDKTFIIAEVGSNHNQSLDLAFEHIDAAIECGADAVKFQSINVDELYHDPSPEVQELHSRIDLREEWHVILSDYCKSKSIIFFSSPTYLKAIDILEDIDVPLYKIASAQIGTFPQLVERVIQTKKPIILSTGIVNKAEMDSVISLFEKYDHNDYIILHCNSIYPTPFEKVNLPLMDYYADKYSKITGFSDHTEDIYVPIAAVARGAKVIEKHFTLSKDLPVPDASISIDVYTFKRMVQGIRATELAMKEHPREEIQKEELGFKNQILTRVIAKQNIKVGDILTLDMVDFKRQSSGISCLEMDKVISQVVKREVKAGEVLEWTDVK